MKSGFKFFIHWSIVKGVIEIILDWKFRASKTICYMLLLLLCTLMLYPSSIVMYSYVIDASIYQKLLCNSIHWQEEVFMGFYFSCGCIEKSFGLWSQFQKWNFIRTPTKTQKCFPSQKYYCFRRPRFTKLLHFLLYLLAVTSVCSILWNALSCLKCYFTLD